MKLSVAFFLLVTQPIFAQHQPKGPTSPDSIPKRTHLDSTYTHLNSKIDSLQLRLNNVLNLDLKKLTLNKKKNKLETPDSLRAVHEFDSLKSGLDYKIDSLRGLNLPTEKYTRKLDSLNNIGPQKYVESAKARVKKLEDQVNQPIQQVSDKVNHPIDKIEGKVNDKLNVMRQEGGADASLPGNLSAGNIGLDKVNLPNADVNTGLDIGDINSKVNLNVDSPVGDQMGKLNGINEKAADIKNIPHQQIQKVNSIDGIQNAKEKVGDVNQVTDKVQAYGNDAKNIAQGNVGEVKAVPDAIEKKIGGLDEIKDLQKQTAEIDQLKDLSQQGGDPKALQELATQRLQKEAVNHFAGKEQVLQAAMDKMAKLKSKYSTVTSLKDVPKRVPNAMKGKPLTERIVPGLTLQFQKTNHLTIDINPVVSYRFTGRINAGVGWNERLVFVKWNKLSIPDRIFGPRAFGSFGFKRDFALKAELEKMNTLVPVSAIMRDGGYRWVWSAFVGIKKNYTFFKNVIGNVQILYNVYDDHDSSPYVDRLNVRMGFEMPMKKKIKPETK